MVDGFKTGTAHASLHASYEFYFGPRKEKTMPQPLAQTLRTLLESRDAEDVVAALADAIAADGYRHAQAFGDYGRAGELLVVARYLGRLSDHLDDYEPDGRDRDEWTHEAAQAMRLKR